MSGLPQVKAGELPKAPAGGAWRQVRTLWELMAGQRLRYGAALAAMALSIVAMYATPLVLRSAIDGVIEGRPLERPWAVARLVAWLGGREVLAQRMWICGLGVALATAVSGAFMYLKGRWTAQATEAVARGLRERLYGHLQHLPMAYHAKAQTGDLVQRCTSDVDTLRLFYSGQVTEIVRAAVLLVSVLPILVVMDWRMALAAMAMLPVIVLFAVVFFGKVRGQFKQVDDAEGAMSGALQENLTGIRVVRAFARQEHEKEKFRKKNATHRDLHDRLFRIMAVYWSSSDLLCFGQGAAVLFYGAWRVSGGKMSVGTLVAFLSYTQMYIWPVRQMGRVLTELGKATVSLGRIQEILEQPEEASPAAPAELTRMRGEISLRDVKFAYDGKLVLDGVSLEVPAGRTVALLGPSGSGKSTLVGLLLRFYDAQSGVVALDGVDVTSLDRKYVRSQFGVVMQEPFLYSKTIGDNLRIGRFSASDAEVTQAAEMACVHESIDGFEKKYQTLVGERGVTLSGGQRQRVALARALLKDAPVLILDDALSAVDTHTEAQILEALKGRRGRHTTLLIAHRLSTLMHADQIVVLEHGKIVQQGTHAELVDQDGLYRRLWQIQGALEDDLRSEMAGEETGPAVAAH